MTYYLSITEYEGAYQIGIYDTRDNMMRGHKPDYYQAETPEELLVFLMGVYDWYPEEIEWDEEDYYKYRTRPGAIPLPRGVTESGIAAWIPGEEE